MNRGMQYRPEYRLDRLRMMMLDRSSSNGRRAGEPLLHPLRWLRTMVVDLSHTADADVGELLALQQRSAVGCAVERVVCKQLNADYLSHLLPFITHCVALLTSLDLRGCSSSNLHTSHFAALADTHSSSLRRLYLPWHCSVTQSTLDRFTQLEELDASGCENLTNVDFCSATLRVLYANDCYSLTDAGLRKATRLEVLHVRDCKRVTDASPFAHCLVELDASSFGRTYGRGIGSKALSDCRHLQVLHAHDNDNITTLQPFVHGLRELHAGGRSSALNDAALADATGLVSLSVSGNRAITTVAPFGASLRRLDASYSRIDDAGLVTATHLVYLKATIRSLAPFAASLLELDASFLGDVSCLSDGIDNAALSAATKLIWVNVFRNETITTLQSCGRSVRHLVARYDSALTNEGLSTVTQLVTLYSLRNPNLTTIEPFLHSLEELTTDSTLMVREVAHALHLHRVVCWEDTIDADRFFAAAGFSKCCDFGTWCRTISSYGDLRPWRDASSHRNDSARAATKATTRSRINRNSSSSRTTPTTTTNMRSRKRRRD